MSRSSSSRSGSSAATSFVSAGSVLSVGLSSFYNGDKRVLSIMCTRCNAKSYRLLSDFPLE